jgi:hypothetical protein
LLALQFGLATVSSQFAFVTRSQSRQVLLGHRTPIDVRGVSSIAALRAIHHSQDLVQKQ